MTRMSRVHPPAGPPHHLAQGEGAAGAEPATCWMALHWIPPADPRDREAALRSGRIGASEGPFTTEYATEKLVGRVVGCGCRQFHIQLRPGKNAVPKERP